MKKILVTGATGFVGRGLLRRLCVDNFLPAAALRREVADLPSSVSRCMVDGVQEYTDWTAALRGQNAVVHCAARAHIMRDTTADPLEAFRSINFRGTLSLARQAANAGIRRFIFISSVGVNGAETFGVPFREDDISAPHSPYAVAKYEAEMGLQVLAAETDMKIVIIRPTLVYGPNAPGNFGSLMRWLKRGIPLPLGALHNQRSLVALDNLVDLIVTCITHPAAANQTFLVSDGEDVSTSELLRRMGRAMGRPARLIPVPVSWLKLAAAMVGKPDVAQRLCGSLQVDIEKTRCLLGWSPPLSLDEGLRRAVGMRNP